MNGLKAAHTVDFTSFLQFVEATNCTFLIQDIWFSLVQSLSVTDFVVHALLCSLISSQVQMHFSIHISKRD